MVSFTVINALQIIFTSKPLYLYSRYCRWCKELDIAYMHNNMLDDRWQLNIWDMESMYHFASVSDVFYAYAYQSLFILCFLVTRRLPRHQCSLSIARASYIFLETQNRQLLHLAWPIETSTEAVQQQIGASCMSVLRRRLDGCQCGMQID